MIIFSVTPDQDQLREAKELFQFVGGNAKEAVRIAVNKTAQRMRIVARKEIRKDVRLSLSYVNDKLKVRTAKKGQDSARITTPSRGLRLTKYSIDDSIAAENVSWIKPPLAAVRQKGGKTPPFMVQVKPNGSLESVTGKEKKSKPFVIVGKNNGALILVQRNAAGKLDALYGPSLSQVFSGVRERIIPDAEKELIKQMNAAMNTLLKKQFPAEEEVGLPE